MSEETDINPFMDDFLGIKSTASATLEPEVAPSSEPAPEVAPEPEVVVASEPEPEPAEVVVAPEPDPEPAVDPEPEAAAAPEVPEPASPFDYEKLGETVADAIKRNDPQVAKDPEPEPYANLSAAVRKKIPYLKRMGELDPAHKGLADKFVAAHNKLSDYRIKWETDNPGDTWRQADPEHDNFLDSVNVTWDDDDYTEAVADVMTDKRVGESRRQVEALKRELKMGPELAKRQKDVRTEVVRDHKDSMDVPVIGALVASQADYAVEMTEAIHKIYNGGDYDANNPIHQRVEQLSNEAEKALQANPANKLVSDDGRRFATMAEFAALAPAQQAGRWIVSADMVEKYTVGLIKDFTNKSVEAKESELGKYAESRGFVRKDGTVVSPPAKPKSPASLSETKMSPTDESRKKDGDSEKSEWAGSMIG